MYLIFLCYETVEVEESCGMKITNQASPSSLLAFEIDVNHDVKPITMGVDGMG